MEIYAFIGQGKSTTKEKGKSETMDTKGMSMLSNENYQEWKKMMMSNLMDLGYDVWN